MLRKSKCFLTVLLVLMVCFVGTTSAFATNLNGDDAITGTEGNPVQAAITKNLRLPEATTIPNVQFNFIVTPIMVDDTAFNPDEPNMPVIGTKTTTPGVGTFTISFSSADAERKESVEDLVNTMSIQKETPNIFEGVTFDHAGIYVYTITEEQNTNSAIDDSDNVKEWLSYSPAVYTLTVFVENTEDGKSTFIYALGTLITTPNPGQPQGDKVDPTPGSDEDDHAFSQMVFINDYVKNHGPIDPKDASVLEISKTVTGDFASRDHYFEFSIILDIPSIVANIPEFYRAYIVDVDGTVGNAIEVSTDAITTFDLKHGQRLVFVDTPIGTGYVVTETGAANYFPSLSVTTNGEKVEYREREKGEDFPSGPQLVGELVNGNSADFTNRRDSVTPTGLNLNDLPFIGLIALCLGALTIFIVVKVRKRAQNH